VRLKVQIHSSAGWRAQPKKIEDGRTPTDRADRPAATQLDALHDQGTWRLPFLTPESTPAILYEKYKLGTRFAGINAGLDFTLSHSVENGQDITQLRG